MQKLPSLNRRAADKRAIRSAVAMERCEPRTLFAAGNLDLSLGGTGKRLTHIAGEDVARDVIFNVNSSTPALSKIIVVGDGASTTSNEDIKLVRYNANGSLDTSFGQSSSGKSVLDFTRADKLDGTKSVRSGGLASGTDKILVAGTGAWTAATVSATMALSLISADGSTLHDSDGATFGSNTYDSHTTGGMIVNGSTVTLVGVDRTNQGSGGGNGPRMAIAKFLVNTTNDTVTLSNNIESSLLNTTPYDVVQTSGDDFIAAVVNTTGVSETVDLVKYTANTNTFTEYGFDAAYTGNAMSVALSPDGAKVILAYQDDTGCTLARFNTSNGSLDSSFSGDGLEYVSGLGTDGVSMDIAVQGTSTDYKIIAAAGAIDYIIARVDDSGSLDTSFGSGGLVTTQFYATDYSSSIADQVREASTSANAVRIDPAGRIVAVGDSSWTEPIYNPDGAIPHLDFSIARYLSDGITTFDPTDPVIPGTSSADRIYVKRDSTNVKVWINAPTEAAVDPTVAPTDAPTHVFSYSALNSLTFNTLQGNDRVTIDLGGGAVIPTGGVTVNGGNDTDEVRLLGTSSAETVNFNSAQIVVGSSSNVPHTSIEGITFDGKHGDDPISVNAGPVVTFTASQHFSSLLVASGASAAMRTGGNKLLVTDSLTIGTSGTLDMTDEDLIVDYSTTSPAATIQTLINSGRSGGSWTGTGITSTSARNRSPKITTLGLLLSTEYQAMNPSATSFDGETLDSTMVLVKYTFNGDTDFNGLIDFDDHSRVDAGMTNERTGWMNGDADGNGIVDFDDYSLVDQAFNNQGTEVL